MSLENIEDPKDRLVRIESEDDEIFKQAYLKLKSGVQFAESKFKGLPMHTQLKQRLDEYTPRYEQLTNQPPKRHPSQ